MFRAGRSRTMARMTNTAIQPPGIVEIPGLTQVIVASGSRHVYIAGQIPIDEAGALIGEGDLHAQAVASPSSTSGPASPPPAPPRPTS